MRILFISPHPDDECDNAGGTLAKLAKSHEIYIVYMTDGSAGSPNPEERGEKLAEIRRKEALEGLKVLGIKKDNAFFLNYPDTKLRFHIREASERVARILREIKPNIIIYPSLLDGHNDHWSGGYITRIAIRKVGITVNELSYLNWLPIPSKSVFDAIKYLLIPFHRKIKVDVREYKRIKLEAMKKHESQFKYLDADYTKKFFDSDYETFYVERIVNDMLVI